MTQDILVRVGEEYFIKNALDGDTFTIGLYNDSTDNIVDGDNLSNITTEPTNGNYSRQSITVSTDNIDSGGDWGIENDAAFDFDFTDVSPGDGDDITVDSGFWVANFQSEEEGDGSATDNLIGTFALTQDRETGQIDSLRIEAGDAEATLD